MKKKFAAIFAVCVVCVIVIYEAVILIINDAVPLAEGNVCEVVSVDQRIDESGKTFSIDLSEDQKEELENYILGCTKKMTFFNSSARFSGTDYNVFIRFVSFNEDEPAGSFYMLIGRKNTVQSGRWDRNYKINDPEKVEKDIKYILQI